MVMAKAMLGLLIMVGAAPAWRWHPVHASRLELVASDRKVTATILVFRDDFPPGTRLPAIAGYLGRTLRLTEAGGRPVTLRPVTVTAEAERLRIELQGTSVGPLRGGRLAVTVLHEQFTDQVNVAAVRIDGRRAQLVFLKGDAAQGLP